MPRFCNGVGTSFVEAVKHRRRFFFTRKERDDEDRHPARSRKPRPRTKLLDRFGKGCAHGGLVKTIPGGDNNPQVSAAAKPSLRKIYQAA